jgi:hypothetical protein
MRRFHPFVYTLVAVATLAAGCSDSKSAGEKNAAQLRALARPFTIVAIPDTQVYAEEVDNTHTFKRQVEWILANRTSQNIVLATHLGDVVDNGEDPGQWSRAMVALQPLLDQAALPYSVVRGNHDAPAFYLDNITLARDQAKPWFAGAAPGGLTRAQRLTVDGATLLHVGFQKDPTAEELSWAGKLLDANPGVPAMVSTHDYVVPGGRSVTGEGIWQRFIEDHPAVFLVMNGHTHTEFMVVNHDAAGKPVVQMLADYQDRDYAGGGLMRLITVDPVAGKIDFKTFSPHFHTADATDPTTSADSGWELAVDDNFESSHFETDANSEFSVAMNVRERLAFFDSAFAFGAEPPAPPPDPLEAIPALDQAAVAVSYSHVFQNRRPPAGATAAYTGAVDTQLNENNARLDYGGEWTLTTDMDDAGSRVHALLRFDGLVGTGPGQIPPGSTILSARLMFHVTSSTKGTVSFHRMLLPWSEASTWMDFTPVDGSGNPTFQALTFYDPSNKMDWTLPSTMVGGGLQPDDVEAMATLDAQFTCKKPVPVPFFSPDVTAAVQSWVDGQANHGWAILPDSTDGWDFETAHAAQPPALLVLVQGATPVP